MRVFKIMIIAVFTVFTLNSCDSFLESEPTTQITSGNYYTTPAEAFSALTGCYNGLDLLYNTAAAQQSASGNMMDPFPIASEVLSDNCLGGMGSSDALICQSLNEFNTDIFPAGSSLMGGYWKNYYQCIFRCNSLLANLGKVDWTSDNTITRPVCEGEARFIRAYVYFDLVRLFENVPLLTEPTSDNVAQATPDETYAQIISDLKFAAENLPATSVTSTPYSGRVTKWAAESMLARVFLFYTGYYGKADCAGFTKEQALAAITDVRDKSGHAIVSDFNSLWPAAARETNVDYAGENNSEIVFSIKYTNRGDWSGNSNWGNTWMVLWSLRNGGANATTYPYSQGWGFATVDPKLFQAFAPSDSRKFASILDVSTEIPGYTPPDTREYTGYIQKKYINLCAPNSTTDAAVALGAGDFQLTQYQDYFVMRFADVLLMSAELELLTNPGQALIDFNAVHARSVPTAATSVTQADIMNERRFEFAFEGIRYWDLLRQGVSTAATTIYNNTSLDKLYDKGTNFSVSNITAKRGFQQIPSDQITLSGGVLKQNQGW